MTVFALPKFKDESLWQQAMTHRSYANEQFQKSDRPILHNERLEFLGDAILTFVSGAYLYQRYPERTEGELTPLRAALVGEPQFCYFAQQLGLGSSLQIGKGAVKEGSRQSTRLLCSTFEVMIGAYFLDTGGDASAVAAYVLPMFDAVIEQAIGQGLNAKSRLQEWAQKELGEVPEYVLLSSSGPDHAKTFVVEVRIGQKPYGQGQGRSKKEAEKEAAKAALENFESSV